MLTGFTVSGMGFAAALAARLDLGFASDVIAVRDDGGLVAEREMYGAKVRAELEFPGKETDVLMLRPTTWEPAEGAGSAQVSTLVRRRARLPLSAPRVRRGWSPATSTSRRPTSCSRSAGASARRRTSSQFEELAERMGATLGVSRPLVDAGWMPSSRQVGQSGKTVKPKVYLAFGISGAVQHLAGMKTSGTIIAINTDPEAAIFNLAHYGAVADIFDVAEELEKLY